MPAKGLHHSEEKKQKIREGNLGKKRSPEAIENSRLARLGLPSSRKGVALTDETKQKLREARKKQIHPSFAKRGFTREQIEEAAANGLRWCAGKCKAFLPTDKFYGEPRTDKSGLCSSCSKVWLQDYRNRRTPDKIQADADYLWDWRKRNSEHVRREAIKAKYGVTPEWYEKQLEAQCGHCALCEQTLVKGRKFLFIDHDHACCRSVKKTCGLCVRGILCYRCNTFLGQIEVPGWLDAALAYVEKYRKEIALRKSVIPLED